MQRLYTVESGFPYTFMIRSGRLVEKSSDGLSRT